MREQTFYRGVIEFRLVLFQCHFDRRIHNEYASTLLETFLYERLRILSGMIQTENPKENLGTGVSNLAWKFTF